MNTNDLRYVKTETILKQVYMDMKMKSTRPVKLVDLCKNAMINKTTFYSHYETLEEFHRHVCRDYIYSLLESCENITEAFSDTNLFVSGLVKTFAKNRKTLTALFGDNENDIISVVEDYLLEIYCQGETDSLKNLEIKFVIGGATRILLNARDEETLDKTVKMIRDVLFT